MLSVDEETDGLPLVIVTVDTVAEPGLLTGHEVIGIWDEEAVDAEEDSLLLEASDSNPETPDNPLDVEVLLTEDAAEADLGEGLLTPSSVDMTEEETDLGDP